MESILLTADHSLTALLLTTCALPLVSFILSLSISERYAWAPSISAPVLLLATTVLSAIIVSQTAPDSVYVLNFNWISIGSHDINASLLINKTSALMLFVVSVISFLVHFYSAGYMASDLSIRKYFALLGFFTFAMFGIVLADNLFLLFFFWELVGFSSYMLIGHHTEKKEAGHASMKAFIANRIGDAAFLVGLMITWSQYNTLDISSLTSFAAASPWQTAASICFFLGIAGKSAQFPLFTWLPDAMVGPTPVSALIHAATMVAAGVYLMIRIFPLFTDTGLTIVAIAGAGTSLLAALSATSQFDIKKILAYSTVSQLGLMFIALGNKAVDAAWLHLYTHAFFKACLFLSAGSIIHALHQSEHLAKTHFDAHDIRNMGNLRRRMPVTFFAFIISAAALAGIPLTSGFLSKDFILAMLWNHPGSLSTVMFFVTVFISLITVVYTARLVWFVFFFKNQHAQEHIFESPIVMRLPIIVLAFASLWLAVSPNPLDYSGWIVQTSVHFGFIGLTAIAIVLTGILIAYMLYRSGHKDAVSLMTEAFYIDRFSTQLTQALSGNMMRFSTFVDRSVIDKTIHFTVVGNVTFAHVIAWVDRYLVDGTVSFTSHLVRIAGNTFRNLGSGKMQHYVFWSLFAIIIFIIWALN